MKYFLRTSSHWYDSGYLEWSPGKDKWYPISVAFIFPMEKRIQLIEKIAPYLHKTKEKIPIHAYYDNIKKELHIIAFPGKVWIDREDIEEDVAFVEDILVLDLE